MRIIALHNAAAGSQKHDDDAFAGHLERAGHEVVRVVRRLDELQAALREERCDLIAVGGGDGTVGKAARAAWGSAIPIAILPAGTANNVARAIGVEGDLDDLVASWPRCKPRPFDAAVATWSVEVDDGAPAPLATRQVFECFGFGAFCQAMAEASKGHLEDPPGDAVEKLARDRKTLRRCAEAAPVRDYRIDVDGTDCSGPYLMVELMLIPFIGPNVELAPDVRYDDGCVDVVLIRESERAQLVRHLDLMIDGHRSPWRTRPLRGARVRIEANGDHAHADGKLCVADDGGPLVGPVTVTASSGAYRMLVPSA